MALYLLNVIEPGGSEIPGPEVLEPIMRDVQALQAEMEDAGVWVFAGGLHGPDSSTTVRHAEGRAVVTDGPFAETKEHVGGFTVVDVADLDEALTWADKASRATTLPIEVRPFR